MSACSRRHFLQTGVTGAALLTGGLASRAEPTVQKLPQRVLGKTDVQVPILGLGTVALGAIKTAAEAEKLIHRALDLGVTYIDTAPAFGGYGKAQSYLNGILKERRKEVFIATKCLQPDSEKAIALLRSNLKELGLDRVDLAYAHSIGHAVYKLDQLAGDAGTLAGLEKARKEGLCRFVGVTGHNRPEKFAELLQKRDIDVMMNAVNIVDRHTYAFEDVVWPIARQKKIGLVAMKVFGGSVIKQPCRMPEALRAASFRYTLSIPGVALNVIGIATIQELEQNVEWARSFKPMTADEAREWNARTVELAREWGTHLDVLDPNGGEKSRPLVNT